MKSPHPIDRRAFLATTGSCAAHLTALAVGYPYETHRLYRRTGGKVITQETWGRLEQLGDGLWALISTPVTGSRETLSNGGIIAGRNGVVVVESFATNEGAQWMARQARGLTGRWPTHVILTHYHGDHTNGLLGYLDDNRSPQVHATEATRDLVRREDIERGRLEPRRGRILADLTVLSPADTTRLDLGGRVIDIIPRRGHTSSDVTVELSDPSVVWCGDLVWNGMFPNYRDATPSQLTRDVRALMRERDTIYVSGHGPVADRRDMNLYLEVLDRVEEAGRRSAQQGISAERAATDFTLPAAASEWTLFSPRYFEVAIRAWHQELVGSP